MGIFFTSDLHWGHQNVLKYCPNREFRTIEEMDWCYVNNINSMVGPDDEIYFLGDLSMSFQIMAKYVRQLVCQNKYLVPGNHDFVHSYHKRSRTPENREKWIAEYEKLGWLVLPEIYVTEFPEIGQVRLCHHPHTIDVEPDKYAKWRPPNNLPLICGHVHQHWKTNGNMINVGVDVWDGKPVPLEALVELIRPTR